MRSWSNAAVPPGAARSAPPVSVPVPGEPSVIATATGLAPAAGSPAASRTATATGPAPGTNAVSVIASPTRAFAGCAANWSEQSPVTAVSSALPAADNAGDVPGAEAVAPHVPPAAPQAAVTSTARSAVPPGARPRPERVPPPESPGGGLSVTLSSVAEPRLRTVAVRVRVAPAGTLAGARLTAKRSTSATRRASM
jgi:hypothetical protein